jgi:hypothetical protein
MSGIQTGKKKLFKQLNEVGQNAGTLDRVWDLDWKKLGLALRGLLSVTLILRIFGWV